MEEIEKLKLLLRATRTEIAIKQVELLRTNSQINATEAQLELLKIKAKELKDIINKNNVEILDITAKLYEEAEKPKDNPENKTSVTKETRESSQRSHPHWNHGNNSSDDEAAYAELHAEDEEALRSLEDEEALRSLEYESDYNEYEPYEYEVDSDLEDAILNRLELD